MADMERFVDTDKLEDIKQLCQSKAEEFAMLGYDNITYKDVWDCVATGFKGSEKPAFHKVVNEILSLKINKYMNYVMINMYKNNGSI